MKKKKSRKKRPRRGGKPTARIPLPRKGEKRHGDRTKYSREREKQRLRAELDR